MDKKKKKIVDLLRLAKKANAISLGRKAVEKNIKKNKTKLIFSGKRNNNFIRKKYDLCQQRNIKILFTFSDEELGEIFNRRKLTLVAIKNSDFIEGIKNLIYE